MRIYSTVITFTRSKLLKLLRASNIALPSPVLAGLKMLEFYAIEEKAPVVGGLELLYEIEQELNQRFQVSLHYSIVIINANNLVVVPRQPLL